MQIQIFKIHGDNIVECERIFNFISRRINIIDINKQFISQMLGYDTTKYEDSLLDKNLRMVNYFSIHSNGQYYFKPDDWQRIYKGETTVLELSKEKKWQFGKKIAEKSMTGHLVLV